MSTFLLLDVKIKLEDNVILSLFFLLAFASIFKLKNLYLSPYSAVIFFSTRAEIQRFSWMCLHGKIRENTK